MNSKQFINQLSQLIATPSVSCTSPDLDMANKPVVNLLAQWLEDLGFTCLIQDIAQHPGKANLIATKGTGPGGLVLSGHTDTVPFNAKSWQQDPFTLTEKDHRLYGLGATDMKGFFPVVLAALAQYQSAPPKQPIIVLATADEESSMSGARALAEAGAPLGRYAVIGEPTGMRPIRMHKGIMMEALKLTGLAGHSSNPDLGKNALEIMNLLMTELLAFRAQLQQKYKNTTFDVAVPTLNLGCIHGGDNPNRICQHCELHFDLRPLPGMNIDELRTSIHNRLAPIAKQHDVALEFTPLFSGVAPYEQAADSDIVKLSEKLTGHSAKSVAFATEAPFLQSLGMETIVMGPGSIDQAHQPNEFIELSEIKPAIKIIGDMIKHLCY